MRSKFRYSFAFVPRLVCSLILSLLVFRIALRLSHRQCSIALFRHLDLPSIAAGSSTTLCAYFDVWTCYMQFVQHGLFFDVAHVISRFQAFYVRLDLRFTQVDSGFKLAPGQSTDVTLLDVSTFTGCERVFCSSYVCFLRWIIGTDYLQKMLCFVLF